MTLPLTVFNFSVAFHGADGSAVPLCAGRFSEVSGIEATMEPKSVRVGGRNHGEVQRVGPVRYATVILKRGVTTAPDLWTWFELVAGGKSAVRLRAQVIQHDHGGAALMRWTMENALPIKFKAATYAASVSDVGVEELHFVHEKLTLTMA